MASSLNSAWQEWMTTLLAGFSMAGASEGGVSRQTLAATLPPDRYYCLLDELPLHLIPQRDRQKLNRCHDRSQPLFLNPACKLCPAGQLPDELLSQDDLLTRFDLNAFASQGTIAWVRDATSGNLLPFWLGPALESVLHDLGPNEPLSPSVPDRARCLLEAADILLPQRQDKLRRREREKEIRKAGALFQRKGYAPFSRWIHPFHIAALRRYYRYLIRTGKVQLGDGQSPRRYVAYNEPVARFFHRHIAATLSSIAGEPLKPS